jgi:hypothetical protein
MAVLSALLVEISTTNQQPVSNAESKTVVSVFSAGRRSSRGAFSSSNLKNKNPTEF